MRISDLSRRSGVPVATIKFYLREGLLPPGIPTARNQAVYEDRHLWRIRLVRALINFGRFDLASVRELLTAIDGKGASVAELYGMVGMMQSAEADSLLTGVDVAQVRRDVVQLIDELGWKVAAESQAGVALVHVVATLRGLGCAADMSFFVPFAHAAEQVVEMELALFDPAAERALGAAVVRNVMFEALFRNLGWMARENRLTGRS